MKCRHRPIYALIAAAALFSTTAGWADAPFTFTPYKSSDIYAAGEKVGWNVALTPGQSPTGAWKYTIKKNNWDVLKTGTIDPAAPAPIEITLDEPAMLFVQLLPETPITSTDPHVTKEIDLGAAVAPEKIQPAAPRPADFDAFWNAKIQQLHAIPENPVLTPADAGKPDIDFAILKMDHINNTHVYGQIAKPKREGKFPALVIFQWASPPYPLQKQWVTDRAAEGWLALNIEPHDVLPDQPKAYYDALPQSLKNYQSIGRDDRDKNYFLQMYLADYRAIDYITSCPDWDGKTIVVMGTSMGGQQSLCVAGLHPKVTGLIVNVPAGCDSNGALHHRAAGYPNWPSNDPKVMETALYFDAVNFAPHIHAPSMVAMGFIDTIAPPVGIWTAFNEIPAPKEVVPLINSPHNNFATPAQQQPYYTRSAQWLNAYLHEGHPPALPPTGDTPAAAARASVPADQPVPRADRGSQLAHEQLLQKAHTGKIDVYFEGDSITRRWGATDPQYKDLLANWKQNFFGWNAADFGWGGDTTQNILWRLDHGELDNVHPKAIVLMAGTNNVGKATPNGDLDARATDIANGIKAILARFHDKAPDATVILTAITPRNDNIAVMPLINKINAKIATLADGHAIRYININDKLADPDGHLFEGIADGSRLHLTPKAYQIWADALSPILTSLLGPRSTTSQAPPATGDVSVKN